jgi:hypothetical protein
VSGRPVRLVAVLGYSSAAEPGLHPVCADRLSAAEGVASPGDAVLLSGWARHPARQAEAELMRNAWRGPAVELRVDPDARTTGGNAAAVADHVRRLGADEVVVVTSSWHAPRARMLVRAATSGTSARVLMVIARHRPSRAQLLREATCWLALPLQLLAVRRARPVRT